MIFYYSSIFTLDLSTIILYILAFVLLLISFIKDRHKTKIALKKGWMSFKKIMPILIPLFIIVGIILTIVTPDMIKSFLGEDSGALGILIALIVGSVSFLPPFVTYPLGAELIREGAGYPQVAALVTALMGVGFVYLFIESKFFGSKATFLRNGLALMAAAIVAVVVMVVM